MPLWLRHWVPVWTIRSYLRAASTILRPSQDVVADRLLARRRPCRPGRPRCPSASASGSAWRSRRRRRPCRRAACGRPDRTSAPCRTRSVDRLAGVADDLLVDVADGDDVDALVLQVREAAGRAPCPGRGRRSRRRSGPRWRPASVRYRRPSARRRRRRPGRHRARPCWRRTPGGTSVVGSVASCLSRGARGGRVKVPSSEPRGTAASSGRAVAPARSAGGFVLVRSRACVRSEHRR